MKFKYLSIFMLSVCIIPLCLGKLPAQGEFAEKGKVQVYALDEEIELDTLSDDFEKYPLDTDYEAQYVSSAIRDDIFKKVKVKEVENWSEDELLIFQRSIMKTPYKYLKRKYPFLAFEQYSMLLKLFDEEL